MITSWPQACWCRRRSGPPLLSPSAGRKSLLRFAGCRTVGSSSSRRCAASTSSPGRNTLQHLVHSMQNCTREIRWRAAVCRQTHLRVVPVAQQRPQTAGDRLARVDLILHVGHAAQQLQVRLPGCISCVALPVAAAVRMRAGALVCSTQQGGFRKTEPRRFGNGLSRGP